MKPYAILEAAAEIFEQPLDEILGRRRLKRLTPARQAAAWALRRAGVSVIEVGELLKRDHTSVIYGARQAEEVLRHDPRYTALFRELAERIGLPLPEPEPAPPPARRVFVITPQVRLWMWSQRNSVPIPLTA